MAAERIFVLICTMTCFLINAQGADNYTDGNRPYEFGFSIEGEQHRHEKKDENGLIMGEFGFITADGVYHVTVYATDEQGRFKILSMKNIRVKPYPTYNAPNTAGKQGHSLSLDAPQQNLPSTAQPFKPISIEPPKNSCSSCSIPTTTKVPPPALPPQPFSTQNVGPSNSDDSLFPVQNGFNPQIPQSGNGLQSTSPFQNNANGPGSQPPGFLQQGEIPLNQPHKELQAPPQEQAQVPQTPENPLGSTIFNNPSQTPQIPSRFGGVESDSRQQNQEKPVFQNIEPQTPPGQEILPGSRTPKRLDDNISQQPQNSLPVAPNFGGTGKVPPTKPVLISAQMQIVDKNTDIYKRGPGEKEGLPNGLNKNDMTNLLYTFNYTVGFHGHFEEGYTNGVKQGYYFVTGRNGIRTRIDYVADENGFRPKISQEVLDLLSDDVPKEETEKDSKYGLKGYEFKWLYYPIETKGR